MRLGVAVPLANEERSVGEFLERVLAQLTSEDRVFCVVDNASRDRTRELVAEWSARDSRVVLVWAPENRCVVDAYFRGYRTALAAGCRWILEMDGGLSHLPEEIPLFIRAMEAGYDYVGGCRFMPGGGYQGPWSRYLISRGGGFLSNLLLGTHMRDMTGGFECFSRAALEAVLKHGVRSRAHFFQTEIKTLMHSWKWTEVPIHYRNPSKSVGKSSLIEAFRNLWALMREKRDRTPQRYPHASPQHQRATTSQPATEGALVGVLTTIQSPTSCVKRLGASLSAVGGHLIVIGDRKGPATFTLPGAEFIPLAEQQELPLRLARQLPTGHYARKNLGYLLAIRAGAGCIYETDDDNAPGPTWDLRSVTTSAQPVAPRVWMNVYRAFSDEHLWPRGFPLDRLTDPATGAHNPATPLQTFHAPIQQGLAEGAPDVDAVWRLILDRPVTFQRGASLWLPPGTWCPFNSQSTWWWPEAYPLLYLPSFCSFRMTDIWRSFVAQRCLWELGHGLVFHSAEVVQERNPHNLLRDFKDEIPGYLQNDAIIARLSDLSLSSGREAVGQNVVRCYEALVGAGFLPADELPLVRAWVDDVQDASALRTSVVRAA
ncbi:MAG: STELLO glycosyltransferase family protein [Planctomycetia bacterium]|nr:STELLO glycosyltransferase family protein [Planctomycetia bacterium]